MYTYIYMCATPSGWWRCIESVLRNAANAEGGPLHVDVSLPCLEVIRRERPLCFASD